MRDGSVVGMPETNQESAATAPDGDRTPAGRNRTGAAVRELGSALGNDLATLRRRAADRMGPLWRRSAAGMGAVRGRLADRIRANRARARARPKVSWRKRLAAAAVMVFAAVLGALTTGAAVLVYDLSQLPLDRRPVPLQGPSLLMTAADGEALGRIGEFSDDLAGREDFPNHLVGAVLSIEDRRFFRHWGIDPWGIARAMRANWSAGGIVEGGSTVTQQLAKLQFVGRERTFARKLREASVALWLDFHLGKDEILTRYLNSVYLGSGAFGMSAAARVYFDKSLAQLTVSEAAMLAALIKAPSQYNPIRNLDAARERAARVLDAMVESGALDRQSAEQAKAAPAKINPSASTARATIWFADWIAKHEFPKVAGSDMRSTRVQTTLVPELQALAERAVEDVLSGPGAKRDATQAALVAMRPDGAVVAMVGGRNYDDSQFNRAVDAKRQPGSAFKLFVYLAALRAGYSLGDTIDASPVKIKNWQPANFGDKQYGRMPLAQAFAQSVNTAAVRLATEVGLKKVVAAARDLGIEAPLNEVPSMALGANEVNLLELTGAFASVRAGRTKLKPWGISAFGADENALRRVDAPGPGQQLDHREELTELLEDVVAHGTGRAAALPGLAAGKTGTSQDFRDAWFVGFNEALVVGVWIGNDDRTPMKQVTGGSLPAQIWQRFMKQATPLVDRIATSPPPQAAARETTGQSQPGRCNYAACASAYRSFRSSDCTYQSHSGERRLCEKGFAADPAPMTSRPEPTNARAQGACNVDLCARQYQSFDPSDCTYRPYGGGARRLCER
jgi:penicillin-binding protein 1A